MIRKLKKLTLQLLTGINVAIILLMLFVGFSDRFDPEEHPLLACVGMTFPAFVIANFLFLGFWVLFCWRRAWVSVAGFLLAYSPIHIYMPVRVMDDPPEGSLKLVSFNVCNFGGKDTHVNDTFDTIFSYLRQQQADIVFLTEHNDTWRQSDTLFAKHFAYNEVVDLSNSEKGWKNHVGIHTRLPILRSERIVVPSTTKVNGAAAFYLQAADDTLLLVGCHLENIHLDTNDRKQYKEILRGEMQRDTARAEGREMLGKLSGAFVVRAQQVKIISQYIRDHAQGKRVIVCGDFNDTPISFSRYTLSRGMKDCFSESGCGLGLSYNQKGFNFRIDHILCSPDMTPYHCQVDTKMNASDHYPVVCWLKMGPKP